MGAYLICFYVYFFDFWDKFLEVLFNLKWQINLKFWSKLTQCFSAQNHSFRRFFQFKILCPLTVELIFTD
jgi:hypothetical protein